MHLLYVGRIAERQKRFTEAVEIFETLSTSKKKFDVVGSPVPKVTAKVMEHPEIVFHGYKKDWSNLVLRNTILIISSDYEGMPLALIEFVSHGGTYLLAKESEWCGEDLYKKGTYKNVFEAVNKLESGNLAKLEKKDFQEYFSENRFKMEITEMEKWL